MPKLLIENCHVLLQPEPNNFVIEAGRDVLIDGSTIAQIAATGAIAHTTVDDVISAENQLLIPGLINTHAHIPMVLFRGLAEDVSVASWFNDYIWPLENNLNEEDVYWGAMLALVEMIEGGVTTVADHYFHMDQVATAVEQAGTRALLGAAIFGSLGMEGLADSAEFAQRWHNQADGRITTIIAPHAPYTCDDGFLRAAADTARQLNLGIHTHAAERISQTESSLKQRGLTPIQVLAETNILERPTLIAHGAGITPEDIKLLREVEHVGVAHCPKTYMKLANDLTPILELRAFGIPVGLGTDGAASNSTMGILEPLRLMTMLQKFSRVDSELMPINEALDVAFRGGASVVGMEGEIGRIHPGYKADLVLLDQSGTHHQPLHNRTASLIYNSYPGDVRTVICNGNVLMRDRKLQTLDKAHIIAQVQKRMQRLAYRDPNLRIQTYDP